MDRKLKLSAVALGALIVLAAVYMQGTGSQAGNSLTDFLNSEGYDLDTDTNYSVEKVSESKVAGIPVEEIQASAGESRVSATIYSGVDSGFASSYIQDKRQELAAIYTDTPAPYEGVPGREVDCPDRFVPGLGDSTDERADFLLYSSSEGKIGACSNSTAEYSTKITVLYCPESESLISIRASQPVEDGQMELKVSCR